MADQKVSIEADARFQVNEIVKAGEAFDTTTEKMVEFMDVSARAPQTGQAMDVLATKFDQLIQRFDRSLDQSHRKEEERGRRRGYREKVIQAGVERFGAAQILSRAKLPEDVPAEAREEFEREQRNQEYRKAMEMFRQEAEGGGGALGGIGSFFAGAGLGGIGRIVGALGTVGGGAIALGTYAAYKGISWAIEGKNAFEQLDRAMFPVERRLGVIRRSFDYLGYSMGFLRGQAMQFAEQFATASGQYNREEVERLMGFHLVTGIPQEIVAGGLGELRRLRGGRPFTDEELRDMTGEMKRRGFAIPRRGIYLQQMVEQAQQTLIREKGVSPETLALRTNLPYVLFAGESQAYKEAMAPIVRQQFDAATQGGSSGWDLFLRRAFARSSPGMDYMEFTRRKARGLLDPQNLQDVMARLEVEVSPRMSESSRRNYLFQILTDPQNAKFHPEIAATLTMGIMGGRSAAEILKGVKFGKGIPGAEEETRPWKAMAETIIPTAQKKAAFEEIFKFQEGSTALMKAMTELQTKFYEVAGAYTRWAKDIDMLSSATMDAAEQMRMIGGGGPHTNASETRTRPTRIGTSPMGPFSWQSKGFNPWGYNPPVKR